MTLLETIRKIPAETGQMVAKECDFVYYERMYDLFLARLLVLLLICLTCSRILFTEHARIDSIVLLSPMALLFSVCILFIWGVDPFSVVLFCLAFLVLFTNGRSLFRFAGQLFVDHYSFLFIFSSILEILAMIALAVLLVMFRPVKYSQKDFEAVADKKVISGTIASGFEVRESIFENKRNDGLLWHFEPAEYLEVPGEPVVLFVPGAASSVSYYEPYLLFLAQKGYRVLAADFYPKDYRLYEDTFNSRFMRRIYSVYLSLFEEETWKVTDTASDQIREQCYLCLADLARKIYGQDTTFFYVTEGLDMSTVNRIIDANEEKTLGVFYLNQIPEFKTPEYGFIEQTDIFLCRLLKGERDASLFIPRYVAGKTDGDIQTVVKALHAQWEAEEKQ